MRMLTEGGLPTPRAWPAPPPYRQPNPYVEALADVAKGLAQVDQAIRHARTPDELESAVSAAVFWTGKLQERAKLLLMTEVVIGGDASNRNGIISRREAWDQRVSDGLTTQTFDEMEAERRQEGAACTHMVQRVPPGDK